MAGLDRSTGKLLAGWPHVVQSLMVIFTTHFGVRVMRRYFGSNVPRLLGENMTRVTILRFTAAVMAAIDVWEPRFSITKCDMPDSATGNPPEKVRQGQLAFTLRGIYRPRGHLGDETPAQGEHTLVITGGDTGIIIT